MRIDKLKNWLTDDYTYIKSKLIEIDGINEDYHSILEISDELNKGIKIKKKEEKNK